MAKVFEEELSAREIQGIVPENTSAEDSVDFVNRYIKSWVTKHLLLKNAESNSDYNKDEVERKVLDYKYALIVFEYQKKYVEEHLDTIVSEKEIEEYYKANIDNFGLKQSIVKGMFVKAPIRAPKLDNFRALLKVENKNYKAIRTYCYRFAQNYVLEDSIWNYFDDLIGNSPFNNIPDKVQFLKKTKFAEISDENFHYFLYINNYKIIDENSPLEFVKPQIVNRILNKRKVDLIQKLERDIYNKALKNKDFEILTNNS